MINCDVGLLFWCYYDGFVMLGCCLGLLRFVCCFVMDFGVCWFWRVFDFDLTGWFCFGVLLF